MRTVTVDPGARLAEVTGVDMDTAVARILGYWHQATPDVVAEGRAWYPRAGRLVQELAGEHGRTREHIAALVSHLSPQTTWKRNILGARDMLAGKPATYCLARNRENASRALASDAPLETFTRRAPKTRSFARNILGDESVVTVDVWAARIALGRREDLGLVLARAGVYEALSLAYKRAADAVGVTPAVMQATTWIVARNGRTD